MAYEIDFHPVGEGAKSGDAITLRYTDGGYRRVMVIDGGYQSNGPKLRDHIQTFYQTNRVDHMVSTHPDNDHIGGLKTILEEMDVGTLWMHVPHLHASRIIGLFNSARWKAENLQVAMRHAYPTVDDLCNLAVARGVNVNFPFQGDKIGPFTVLTPTINMYEGLLPQFRDTPRQDLDLIKAIGFLIQGVGRRVSKAIQRHVIEGWWNETLRDGGMTAAENESSVVLYGDLGAGGILLTADAGLIALKAAADYADASGIPLGWNLRLFQVPHHGSRNNLGPTILNRIIGYIVQSEGAHPAGCIISAGPDDANHPRQVVVNALVRRGLNPRTTRSGIVCFSHGTSGRAGWSDMPALQFSSVVEEYD